MMEKRERKGVKVQVRQSSSAKSKVQGVPFSRLGQVNLRSKVPKARLARMRGEAWAEN